MQKWSIYDTAYLTAIFLAFTNSGRQPVSGVPWPPTVYCSYNVRISCRISAVFSCPMKLQKYPMDVQTCPLMFESCKLISSPCVDCVLGVYICGSTGDWEHVCVLYMWMYRWLRARMRAWVRTRMLCKTVNRLPPATFSHHYPQI